MLLALPSCLLVGLVVDPALAEPAESEPVATELAEPDPEAVEPAESGAAARQPWEGRPPFARLLMTPAERRAYWDVFLALETDEERSAHWFAHIEKMQIRAIERGISLPDQPKEKYRKRAFWRPPYFPEIMTPEEFEGYFPALDAIDDRYERWEFVAAHIRRMQARARSRGVSVSTAEDFDYVFENLAAKAAADAAAAEAAGAAEPAPAGAPGQVAEGAPAP